MVQGCTTERVDSFALQNSTRCCPSPICLAVEVIERRRVPGIHRRTRPVDYGPLRCDSAIYDSVRRNRPSKSQLAKSHKCPPRSTTPLGWTRESIRLHPRCNIRRSSLYRDHHLPHIRQIPVDMKSRRVIHVRPGVVAVVAVIDLDVVNAPFAERFGKQSSIFKNSYQAAGKAMLTISSAVFRVKSSSIPHSYIFHMLKPTEASWRGRLCRQE